jgi:hypothetical protein
MLRRLVLAVLTCALVLPAWSAGPASAASLPSKKQWLADVSASLKGSSPYVDRRVAAGGSKLAVNFDIDNTALASHYAYGKAVPSTLRFANHARGKGVTLLFNTGRVKGDGRLLKAKQQLTRAGYHVAEICGRTSSRETLTHSKQRCRQHFVNEGYTIIANVGNRRTDFVGGSYERAYRLPNYANKLA